MTDISIIVVGTNEKDYIAKCLRSIRNSRTARTHETFVVDNASTDGTSDLVRAEFPGVRLVRNEKRLGYIENNNRIMRQAQGRYVLMLNADIELQENTLDYMLDFMDRHPQTAVSACRLRFEDGALQLTCRRFPTPWTYLCRAAYFFRWVRDPRRLLQGKEVRRYLMLDYDHQTTREVDWMLTAFFLMRRETIDRIGMLDEKLVPPFYLEDMDWCFRARLNGWAVHYVPEVGATHYYQRGSAKRFNRLSLVHMANILLFFKKHGWSLLLGRHRRAPQVTVRAGRADDRSRP
jgi:GT2 family glycosyltransferase